MTTLPRIDHIDGPGRIRRLGLLLDHLLACRAERAANRALRREVERLGDLGAHLLRDIGLPDTAPPTPQLPSFHGGRGGA